MELAIAASWVSDPPPHYSALWRWAQRGLRARNGKRIRLKAVRLGRKLYTTRVWFDAFLDDLRAADLEHFQARDGVESTGTHTAEIEAKRGTGNATVSVTRIDLERQLAVEGL